MTLTVFDVQNYRNEVIDPAEDIQMSQVASKTTIGVVDSTHSPFKRYSIMT